MLVSGTETIQAIMMEVPGTSASIINLQYQKMLREFQNTVKYHKESLTERLTSTCLVVQKCWSPCIS